MAKRRKRTNRNIPAKGRLREMADRLWSRAVRDDWGNRCAVCWNPKCEAHHLIPREHTVTRYNIINGIALCAKCHKFDPDISPHLNAAGWIQWLRFHHQMRYEWYDETTTAIHGKRFTGTKDAAYYCDVIRSLRESVEPEEFERICGIRFSRWLEETDA